MTKEQRIEAAMPQFSSYKMSPLWRITYHEILENSFPTKKTGKLGMKILRASIIQTAIKNYTKGKLYSDTLLNNIIKIEQFNND